MSQRISRFEGIVNNIHEYHYHMLGCGAIGSSAAIQITRMGAENVYLYDYDKVSEPNIGVSQYGYSHINKYKVDALKTILKDISPYMKVDVEPNEFNGYEEHDGRDIVILGFDSMKSRLHAVEIMSKVMKANPFLLIDGRMGAEQYQQYTFPKFSLSKYIKHWYPDDQGDPEPCSMKATSYCSNMAGSFIVNTVRKILTKQPYMEKFNFNFPIMMLGK